MIEYKQHVIATITKGFLGIDESVDTFRTTAIVSKESELYMMDRELF